MDYHFIKGQFNEDELEHAIIELFKDQGYEYVHGDEIARKYEDILLEDDLRAYLSERYAEENLTDNEVQKIINNITLISSTPLYAGNRDTFGKSTKGLILCAMIPVNLHYILTICTIKAQMYTKTNLR